MHKSLLFSCIILYTLAKSFFAFPPTLFTSSMSFVSSASSSKYAPISDYDKSIRIRLDRVKKAVHDASFEALKYAQLEAPKAPRSAADATPFAESHLWESFAPKRDIGGEENEVKRKADASMELGLILFGDSVPVMEEEIASRLTKVETDLADIISSMKNLKSHVHDFPDGITQEMVELDLVELRHKVEFLKMASDVRLLIDQAAAASLGIYGQSGDAANLGMDHLERTSGSQLVQTAQLLEQAHQSLQRIQLCFFSHPTDDATENNIFSPPNHELCFHILESLTAPIRRRRLDLLTKVNHILDTCIGIRSQSLSVQESHGLLAHAWDALFILSKGSRKVEDVLYTLATNIGTRIIQPLLASCSKESTNMLLGPNEPSLLLLKNTSWKVSENSVKMDENTMLGSHYGGHKSVSSIQITGPTCVLEWSVSSSSSLDLACSHAHRSKAILHSFASMLHLLSSIFKFIHDKILCQNNALSTQIGQYLFSGTQRKDHGRQQQVSSLNALLDEIISHMDPAGFVMIQIFQSLKNIIWDFCIPDTLDSSVLSILPSLAESLRKCTTDFELALVEQAFTKETDILSDYAIHFEEYIAEKRRALLLSQCRTMLLKTDYHNTVYVGTDVPAKKRQSRKAYALQLTTGKFDCEDDGMVVFILQKAAISQVAEKLLQMVRDTMNSAVDPLIRNTPILSSRLHASLYRTARELLDLFRIVIPASHGKEISSIPRTTAIFYNDCVYLAHHCLTLGLEYKDPSTESSSSSSNLRNTCTFVDLVPLFRELGDRYLVDMIQSHKDQLMELVGSRLTHFCPALGSTDSVIEWNDAETAQSAGLHHLRNLSHVWKGFLSHDVYSRAMGYLVDAILGLFLDKIFQAKDISEEACDFTSQLLDTMTQGVVDFFMEVTLEEAKKDASIYCRNWDRMNAVETFLKRTLVDITMGLSEGLFSSLTCPELSSLVVAVFQDSEKRRSLLKLLHD